MAAFSAISAPRTGSFAATAVHRLNTASINKRYYSKNQNPIGTGKGDGTGAGDAGKIPGIKAGGITGCAIIKCMDAVLEIDQREAFFSIGRKSNLDVVRESAEITYKHVMEYIGRTAEDGDRFAAIELGGNPIADIAERDSFPEKEFVIDAIPRVGPRFDVKYITRIYKLDGIFRTTSWALAEVKVDRFI